MSDDTSFGTKFVRDYSALVTGVWARPAEEAALLADPTAYAVSKGLPVASGATVQLDRSQPAGPFRQQEIVGDWTADPAAPVLHVPATPLVDFDELTDAELETVGAGNNVIIIIAAA